MQLFFKAKVYDMANKYQQQRNPLTLPMLTKVNPILDTTKLFFLLLWLA